MGVKRFLRYGFDPQTVSYVKRVCGHPLESVFRLFRQLSKDDELEQRQLLQNLALGLPDRVARAYCRELEFLAAFPRKEYALFPYAVIREPTPVRAEMDRALKMPFVVHRNYRFYFPADTTEQELERSYRYFVDEEGILGNGWLEKSPHSYTDRDFKVEFGDVVVDIGCSDGLFSLENIEWAEKVYLIESWSRWKPALEATFGPFKDKVVILDKFVSNKTWGGEIRLEDALAGEKDAHFFIKMDIEGGERTVLDASRDFFLKNRVKLSCCVYHRQDDAEWISRFLQELGYHTRFSDGYMLPLFNGVQFPYFRHGVVYAWNDL